MTRRPNLETTEQLAPVAPVATLFHRSGVVRSIGPYLYTVEARKVEYDYLSYPKPRKARTPSQIVPDPYSNFLESTVYLCQYLYLYIPFKGPL